MPLLHKQKFIKKPIPINLDPNQEIFYCKLTQEIFLDYDEYFERTILCNSLVWTCSLSGKSGLTYSEALQSEEKARQLVSTFPRILEKLIIYLATFTKRGNIKDLLDDVFAFIKDRYFIGEMVTVVVGQMNNSRSEIRKTCKIIDVICPTSDEDDDEDDSSSDGDENEDDNAGSSNKNKSKHNFGIKASKYKYVIETQASSGLGNRLTVRASQICRPKGLLTKDKVQIILKSTCEVVNNIWIVKDNIKEKYSLNTMKFEQFFKGEMPKFDVSFGRTKVSKNQSLNHSLLNNNNKSSPNVRQNQLNHSVNSNGMKSPAAASRMKTSKSNLSNINNSTNNNTRMKKSLSTSAINHNLNNNNNKLNNSHHNQRKRSLNTSASAKLSSKIKKKYSKQKINDENKRALVDKSNKDNEEDEEELRKAAEKEVRMLEAQKLMDRTILSMSDDEFLLWHEFVSDDLLDELHEIEIEYEKIKRKEEREKEKERLRAEKRTQKEYLKELKKPKEDLECEKLMEIPKALPIKTKIPTNLFGDALMIIEFLNCFGDLFDIHADFPNGFNIELLEDALYSKSCNSALCNLLVFYLDWIFKCYDEENFEDANVSGEDETSEIVVDSDDEDISIDQLYHEPIKPNTERDNFVKFAEKYTKLIRNSQGRSLKTIGLDVYTISEMLRLYFLTSGSLHNHKIKFWYQQRGGYTNLDDVGIEFAMHETDIVQKLETTNVFELEPEEKLKIISILCHQLITQVRFRDVIEDNFQKLTTFRAQLRDLQTEENKRLKEEASDRWKKRLEEKAKQKTRLEEIKTNVVNKSPSINSKNDTDNSLQEEEYRTKKQADESAKKREEFLKKEKHLLDEIHEAHLKYSLAPLGKDRYYRRYWIFKSIPGLFVEDDDQYIDQLIDTFEIKQECIDHVNNNNNNNNNNIDTSNDTTNSSILSNNDHKSTISNSTTNTTTVTTTSTIPTNNSNNNNTSINIGKENNPIVTNTANNSILNCSNILSSSYFNTSDIKSNTVNFKKGEIKWSFYHKSEDIEKLINSLNERGLRESELKQNLTDFKAKINEKINKFPYKHLAMNDDELLKHSKSLDNLNSLKPRQYYLSTVNTINHNNQSNNGINHKINTIALAHDYLESDFRDKLLDIEEQIYNGSLGSLKVSDRMKWKVAVEKGAYDPQCSNLTWGDLNVPVSSSKSSSTHENEQLITEIVSDLSKALLQIEQAVERRFLRAPLGDVQKTPDKQRKTKKSKNDDDNDSQSNEQLNRWQTLWNWEKSLMNCTSLSQLFLHLQTLDESIAWSKSALNARCRLCRKKGDADKMLLCDKCDRGHHIYCLRPRLKNIPDGEWFCPECRPKNVEKTPRKIRKSFSEENELYSDENDVDMKEEDELHNDDDKNLNSENEEVNIDDSYDEHDNGKRKSRKRKLEKSDSDIIIPNKTRGRPPAKQSKITTPSITSNDSNHSTSSKSKTNSRHNGHDGSEYQSEEELNGFDNVHTKGSKRTRNGAKSPFEYHINNTSSRNSEMTQRLKITEKLLADLMKHNDAWPFLKPVTKREAPDYFEIIKTPMDFASIKNNINHFKYTDYTNIIDDIRLIFENCRTYNDPSSDIYKIGQRLNNFFENRVKQLNLN